MGREGGEGGEREGRREGKDREGRGGTGRDREGKEGGMGGGDGRGARHGLRLLEKSSGSAPCVYTFTVRRTQFRQCCYSEESPCPHED